MAKFFRTNNFKVVGKLTNAEVRTGTNKGNGKNYISLTLTVQSKINGKDNEFEIGLFANELTNDGKPSQLYTTYSKLPESINKKVEINGEIRENRYYSDRANQMVSAQQLSGRWVRTVSDSTEDEATFEMGGFVVKTLVERQNKDGEVYRYDLTLGQADYNGTGLNMFVLHIDPERRDILAGVEGYNVCDTVFLRGNLVFTVEQVVQTVNNEGGFGEPITRTYTNRQKNFFITGGSAPMQEGEAKDADIYSQDVAQQLIAAYKAHDTELSAKHSSNSSNASAAPVESKTVVTHRQTSLI